MSAEISIAGRRVGAGFPCFVIAEAGVNHNGDLSLALKLVDAAAEARADAVKFQTFDAERLVTGDAPKAEYQRQATSDAESQYSMLKPLELSRDDHRALMRRCAERQITFLSTPFDEGSADLLEELGVCAFKLPSGEVTNTPYLCHVARFKKPLVLSTGMATLGEVDDAVAAISSCGNSELALLHCVSNYPAEPGTVNLRAMQTLRNAYGVPVGYSDHTTGIDVALAAVALGANILEKHLTLERSLPGPDHAASIEPGELVALVRDLRRVESALGDGRKIPARSELETASVARKSLVVVRDVPAGSVLTDDYVVAKRPGTGLSPSQRDQVVGRTARVFIAAGTVLQWNMLA